eukprot:CAMPEP_0206063948 /NCGR_PEP_ID=MMETSP1466-20131121/58481_1 /ASSEMBLY_ACC=CAM_ASM_001126 /TAXON_ID=44452 /ORGANISM="Pavlova gyrans, Strain CCMP608" /LENGTH=110 /DNA_ID=CAMNT_0053439319 /DNA_START=137 /DNA_END=469 /DNA_ORIENTATION=+
MPCSHHDGHPTPVTSFALARSGARVDTEEFSCGQCNPEDAADAALDKPWKKGLRMNKEGCFQGAQALHLRPRVRTRVHQERRERTPGLLSQHPDFTILRSLHWETGIVTS